MTSWTEHQGVIILETSWLVETLKESVDRLKPHITIEATEPIDVERDMLNDDEGVGSWLGSWHITSREGPTLIHYIEICLKNKHVTFTSSSEASTLSSIKGSLDSTSASS
jgi:hypothetical protein